MIRMPDMKRNVSITVKLKNGEIYKNKDITNQPFGEHNIVVSFWHDDKLRAYPIDDVEYYELFFEEIKNG